MYINICIYVQLFLTQVPMGNPLYTELIGNIFFVSGFKQIKGCLPKTCDERPSECSCIFMSSVVGSLTQTRCVQDCL